MELKLTCKEQAENLQFLLTFIITAFKEDSPEQLKPKLTQHKQQVERYLKSLNEEIEKIKSLECDGCTAGVFDCEHCDIF